MPNAVLHDSVSLQHFSVANSLYVLEQLHSTRPVPRWVEAVCDEINDGASLGHPHCQQIQMATWLGAPEVMDPGDAVAIERIRTGLADIDDPPDKHLGEAQSIFIAERDSAGFLTDDNEAYRTAVRRRVIPAHLVIDSVEILRQAVGFGNISMEDAKAIFGKVIDAGRDFRSVHPLDPLADYFDS